MKLSATRRRFIVARDGVYPSFFVRFRSSVTLTSGARGRVFSRAMRGQCRLARCSTYGKNAASICARPRPGCDDNSGLARGIDRRLTGGRREHRAGGGGSVTGLDQSTHAITGNGNEILELRRRLCPNSLGTPLRREFPYRNRVPSGLILGCDWESAGTRVFYYGADGMEQNRKSGLCRKHYSRNSFGTNYSSQVRAELVHSGRRGFRVASETRRVAASLTKRIRGSLVKS